MTTSTIAGPRGGDVYVIDHGAIVFEGAPVALRADQHVTATYLGVGG